jgi:hypothetical protein
MSSIPSKLQFNILINFYNLQEKGALLVIHLMGTSPWEISYTDGSHVFTKNISSSPYTMEVFEEGDYQLLSVRDSHCKGTVEENQIVRVRKAKPTHCKVGGGHCAGDKMLLECEGISPWNIKYEITSESEGSQVFNVDMHSTSTSITAHKPGTYTFLDVVDASHCNPTKVLVEGSPLLIRPLPTATFVSGGNLCHGNKAEVSLYWYYKYNLLCFH